MDHCYGEYILVDRSKFESSLLKHSEKIELFEGISGADVTEGAMTHDKWFTERFGQGQLRYICKKT